MYDNNWKLNEASFLTDTSIKINSDLLCCWPPGQPSNYLTYVWSETVIPSTWSWNSLCRYDPIAPYSEPNSDHLDTRAQSSLGCSPDTAGKRRAAKSAKTLPKLTQDKMRNEQLIVPRWLRASSQSGSKNPISVVLGSMEFKASWKAETEDLFSY